MILRNLDVNNLSRLSSQQVDHVTCIECCKYYVVPTTAACGHSLCHSCWRTRRTCPLCGVQVEKKNLKLNLPLQALKDHVQSLASAFEELFNIKLDEFSLGASNDKASEDSNKHVKEWLASSQNHFSAPVTESQQSIQDVMQSVEQITSSIQIHSENKKNPKSVEVVHVPPVQVDWDKIEEMPDVENVNKNEQNPIGPMDIEPFDLMDDDKEYSADKPRRSSRNNKENKNNNVSKVLAEISSDKNSEKDLNVDSNNKSHKLGKNWNNVKRMKKEFSKLNKKNRNKLNVSIEMCKKTQSVANKAVEPKSQKKLYEIDDNTPEANAIMEAIETSNCNNSVLELAEKDIEVVKQYDENLSKNQFSNNRDIHTQNNMSIEEICTENEHQNVKDMCINNVSTEQLKTQKVCFFKKSALNKVDASQGNKKETDRRSDENLNANCVVNSDDIEITIKIGNTLTNIYIKKKENDVQLKINADREIQTNVENIYTNSKMTTTSSPNIKNNSKNTVITDKMQKEKDPIIESATPMIQVLEKLTFTKKNTASADTATGHFEITESVERELSKIMDDAQVDNEQQKRTSTDNSGSNNKSLTRSHQPTPKPLQGIPEDMEYLNDLDIFDSESVKEGNVQLLKASKNTPSAILKPSMKSNKIKSQKNKRDREAIDLDDLSTTKKIKLTHNTINDEKLVENLSGKEKVVEQDSENINYDALMSQVFANIDADMGNAKKTLEQADATQNKIGDNSISQPSGVLSVTQANNSNKRNKPYENEKYSENIFSMLEKDSELMELSKSKIANEIQPEIEGSIRAVKETNMDNREGDNIKPYSQTNDVEIVELSTPLHDDDSDKSIVEETPQKSMSFTRNKNKNELTTINNTQQLFSKNRKTSIEQLQSTQKNVGQDTEEPINVISLSDTLGESTKTSKNVTVVETVLPRPTLETPLTITKFVDQIKHKSTPMARKSLNFNNENVEEDAEQTLCPSSFVAAKTTQEKEFMHKAFDQSQTSPIQSMFIGKNRQRTVKFCVGGSCLSSSEQANLKLLCLQRNWTYMDKYSKELTHLVVGVDEENKSQRSVKYMCALAAAKWIVSYKWVEKCLQTKSIVDEEPYEALDGTGEPGPRRSRLAKQKLFEGITFYCMPPFSVLDVDTLKRSQSGGSVCGAQGMVRAAGGRVAAAPGGARAGAAPALLLAEPERTQDDKFVYLAMELSIVPVNYEWVLNCLGSYTLGSIYELLLCPASLLPPIISKWPPELISRDYE